MDTVNKHRTHIAQYLHCVLACHMDYQCHGPMSWATVSRTPPLKITNFKRGYDYFFWVLFLDIQIDSQTFHNNSVGNIIGNKN